MLYLFIKTAEKWSLTHMYFIAIIRISTFTFTLVHFDYFHKKKNRLQLSVWRHRQPHGLFLGVLQMKTLFDVAGLFHFTNLSFETNEIAWNHSYHI